MHVSFLLGSGVSRPAGVPSTDNLTRTILTGEGYARRSSGSYSKGQPLHVPDPYVPYIASFLRWLACHVSDYYERSLGRKANYEDLYYVVEQVHDEEVGNLDNPLVFEAKRDIRSKLCECAEHISREAGYSSNISPVTDEILKYIAFAVAAELASPHGSVEYLNFLEEAFHANDSAQLSVFTLNHDLIVEEFLRGRQISVIDGFGPPSNPVRYWNPQLFSDPDTACVVLKLHGSTRWFRFRTDGGDWYDERIVLTETAGIHLRESHDGKYLYPAGGPPLMLIGTFNKILEYTGGIFSDLFAEFRRRLAKADTLVVCGYGFGDKGINGQVIEWLYGSTNRRKLLVVHPRPEDLRVAARGAVRDKWDKWLADGVLRICKSPVEQTTWQDIMNLIGNRSTPGR